MGSSGLGLWGWPPLHFFWRPRMPSTIEGHLCAPFFAPPYSQTDNVATLNLMLVEWFEGFCLPKQRVKRPAPCDGHFVVETLLQEPRGRVEDAICIHQPLGQLSLGRWHSIWERTPTNPHRRSWGGPESSGRRCRSAPRRFKVNICEPSLA